MVESGAVDSVGFRRFGVGEGQVICNVTGWISGCKSDGSRATFRCMYIGMLKTRNFVENQSLEGTVNILPTGHT